MKQDLAKLGTCEEEADESIYWLNMCRDSGYLSEDQVAPLIQEANERTAIFVSSIKTSRKTIND